MREFDAILAEWDGTGRSLLEEAFRAGRAIGKREAAEELKARISAMLMTDAVSSERSAEPLSWAGTGAEPTGTTDDGDRAAPGTVKPTLLKLIRGAVEGISSDDIRATTGFKPNSVRGTLYALQKDQVVKQINGRWFASDAARSTDTESTPVAGGDAPAIDNEEPHMALGDQPPRPATGV